MLKSMCAEAMPMSILHESACARQSSSCRRTRPSLANARSVRSRGYGPLEWSCASYDRRPRPVSPGGRGVVRHSFAGPTPPQAQGWPAIARGQSTLILAPTGSGKTLTAFLWCINRLMFDAVPDRERRCRVLYISPLKALAVDIERNLRAPLAGIANRASARGDAHHVPSIAVRTGDTPAIERARFQRDPADILITTPESLYLLLTSNAREALRAVDTVIIDEIHALVPTKRGRASGAVARAPRSDSASWTRHRCSASASRRRSGRSTKSRGSSAAPRRPDLPSARSSLLSPTSYRAVTIVDTSEKKRLDLTIEVPVEDMARIGQAEDDPERTGGAGAGAHDHLDGDSSAAARAHPRASLDADLRQQPPHCRAAGERAQRARRRDARARAPRLARAAAADRDRGSAQGRPASAASSPPRRSSSASTWARSISSSRSRRRPRSRAACSASAGRATRSARRAAASSCRSSAATWSRARPSRARCTRRRSRARGIRATRSTSWRSRSSRWWRSTNGRSTACSTPSAAPRRSPSSRRGTFEGVLDMLSGRYPSDDFADLRPRLTWDRLENVVTAREGARARRRHQRRHDSRSRPVRRLPRRRARPRRARRRARRRDGVREPRRRDVPPRRVELAHRADHPRPRARLPGAGRAGQDAVLEGRRHGPAARARPRPSASSCARSVAHAAGGGDRAPRAPPRSRRAGRREPAALPRRSDDAPRASSPTTARSSSSAAATSSATGASASSRRSAAASTPRGRWPSSNASARKPGSTSKRCGPTTGSW